MKLSRMNVSILAVVLAIPAAAHGHPVQPQANRELIRIQGYRTAGTPPAMKRRLVLVALGSEHSFAATEWQVFGFSEAGPPATPSNAAAQRFALQGDREDLARFAASGAQQRVTLLAEHRPGSADLFILALDLCPP
jgi:hypothetical protein